MSKIILNVFLFYNNLIKIIFYFLINLRPIFYKNNFLAKLGIAINPKTKVNSPIFIDFCTQNKIDFFLVMTVEPGKGGQELIESCISKVNI